MTFCLRSFFTFLYIIRASLSWTGNGSDYNVTSCSNFVTNCFYRHLPTMTHLWIAFLTQWQLLQNLHFANIGGHISLEAANNQLKKGHWNNEKKNELLVKMIEGWSVKKKEKAVSPTFMWYRISWAVPNYFPLIASGTFYLILNEAHSGLLYYIFCWTFGKQIAYSHNNSILY